MISCTECGSAQFPGTIFCNECGKMMANSTTGQRTDVLPFAQLSSHPSLVPVDTFKLDPPEESKQLMFLMPSSRRRLELQIQHNVRIGRSDPEANIIPELDFTHDQGIEYGISRLHATIQLVKQGVLLTDLGSTNGTSLNNVRLPAQQPYMLKSGDEIKFGDLLVHIFFE